MVDVTWKKKVWQIDVSQILYIQSADNYSRVVFYLQGELVQALQSYTMKEWERILPEQGYTYFLLAKLYTNPSFLHPDKFHKAAKRFLAFQPSTQNNITKEMKEEILQIIRNWNFGK